MFRNFLLVSLRNFQRNKVHTFINVAGLALGIAAATLIFLFVYDEITFESVHPGGARLYSIGMTVTDKNGNRNSFGEVPGGYAQVLKDKFPEVQNVIKLGIFGFPTTIHDKEKDKIVLNQDGELYWVDKDFGDVLYFPMTKGNREKALEQANSMVISESAAKNLFGDEDPINKQLTIKHPYATRGKEVEFIVSGVFSDYPGNTFFRPKYLLNINGLRVPYSEGGRNFDEYLNGRTLDAGFFNLQMLLKQPSDITAIKKELDQLTDFTTRSDSGFYASGRKLTALIKPLSETHFDEGTSWHFVDDSGSKKSVYIFSGIALLILIIASINYMNLATARSVGRAKEVGIRKTLGSRRSELAWQFIQESGMTAMLALLVAMLLVFLLLPSFNTLTGKIFTFSALFNPAVIGMVVVLTLFVTALGGSYPAFYLSNFKPTEVLKGKVSGRRGKDGLRKFLVGFQFAVAIFLIIATVAVIGQMDLIQKSKLNEDGDQVLSVRYGTVAPNEKYGVIKNALMQDKDLDKVTIGNHLPRHDYFGNLLYPFKINSEAKEYNWSQISGDFDFPKTYQLEVIAGRDFDANNPSDSNSVLLNERAAIELHRDKSELLGLQIENTDLKRRSTVIGVVKDFPFQSAYHAIDPLVISPRPEEMDRIMYIKLPKGRVGEKIKAIEQIWKTTLPGVGFDYWFVSDEFGRLYKKEQKIASLSKVFAGLAMCITFLGLYGLASYMAEQKTKEIGIRKALGSSVGQITFLFIKSFLLILLFASLAAVPASWYLLNGWLSTFAYRIPLGPAIFIISVSLVLILMLLTVLYETVKASLANPVKALKHE